jgi:hypothetical protein
MVAEKSGKRKRNYTTARQQALVDNIPTSKTLAEAAIKAGYPAIGNMVVVVDIPRPPRVIDVETGGNGKPPSDNNDHD